MFSVKRSYIVNTLTLFCVVVFVTVNSAEDNGKDAKLESQTGTTEKTLEDIVEALKNEGEKDSIQAFNKDDKAEETTEILSIDVKENIKVKEVLEDEDEEQKGNEESAKPELEETIKAELKETVEVDLEDKEKEAEKHPAESHSEHPAEAHSEHPAEAHSEHPPEVPKVPASKEKVETPTSVSPLHVKVTTFEKEKAPENTYAVWNSKGKICILASFNATFSITYPSKGGEQKAEIYVPKTGGNAKGKCESNSRSPLFQISWEKYALTLMFNKSDEENWVVTSMELTYDTSDPLFDRATNAGKKTARSKALAVFETPVGRSYYCPAQEVVLLYTANKQVVTARFKDIFLHPYLTEVEGFHAGHRCNKVVLDGPDETPFVQDETVPLAVGCTLALITLCILIGFAVHRAYNAAKVDYNNME